jgi:hypothetical protein
MSSRRARDATLRQERKQSSPNATTNDNGNDDALRCITGDTPMDFAEMSQSRIRITEHEEIARTGRMTTSLKKKMGNQTSQMDTLDMILQEDEEEGKERMRRRRTSRCTTSGIRRNSQHLRDSRCHKADFRIMKRRMNDNRFAKIPRNGKPDVSKPPGRLPKR